ncbi:MAG: hypothetical protein JW892_04025 [Anaerolineae bacterium]|nr:hypothetical protein [Anaerolineae bacterium]
MGDYECLVARLVEGMDEPKQLAGAYTALLDELFRFPLWSSANPAGRRIFWGEAQAARRALRSLFDAPGLYLFGSELTPLYLGQTEQTLWNRLQQRYLGNEKSQCQLAATYEQALQEQGIAGFPEEIRAWYGKNFSGTPRLRGAVVFAQYGIQSIWVALFPVPRERVVELESRLIPIANAWNLEHQLPGLINVKHNS